MNNANSSVAAKTIRKRKVDTAHLPSDQEIKEAKTKAYIERKSKALTLAERVSGSNFYYRNWYFPEGKQVFPQHDNLRCVEKYFPFAEGKPLLVDEPRFPYEVDRCEQKKKVLKELGYRYLVIKPTMTFDEAMRELEL